LSGFCGADNGGRATGPDQTAWNSQQSPIENSESAI
jgi:hypothetical protein